MSTEKKASLTEQDYKEAAESLGCEVAMLKAVVSVEAPRGGFDAEGVPVGLFEDHYFDKLAPGNNLPDDSGYGSQRNEHARLAEACKINRKAALQSFSWGRFQIMGVHWRVLGYESLQAFVNAMYESERAQLDAFVRYCKYFKLQDELATHNFRSFAEQYNGPNYRKNKYDGKMAKAYVKFSTEVKK